MAEGRYTQFGPVFALHHATGGAAYLCEDCAAVVLDRKVHDRSHSIEASWAWSLAVLKTAHLAAHVHDRYDVVERIDSRQFDNWSADALAEMPDDDGGEP